MSNEASDPVSDLRRFIAEGRISHEAVQAITGISNDALAVYLRQTGPAGHGVLTLSSNQEARLAGLAAQLAHGFPIPDDQRVTAIVDSLTVQFRLANKNIALLTGLALHDLEQFLDDPGRVSAQTKYMLAVRLSYLLIAVANAAP